MLYIVPTPIGNLKDITLRALEALQAADLILCEDTRHSGKLLKHFEIDKPLLSFHDHSPEKRLAEIVDRLKRGETLALISDAGMPLISDPGFTLTRALIKHDLAFEVLPGASAVITALAGSGLATDSFAYRGFLSPKSVRRKKEIEAVAAYPETLIFYESPHRVGKALQDMAAVLGGEREGVVARELTKKFEEYKRGTLDELAAAFLDRKVQGEIVILVAGAGRKPLFTEKASCSESSS